MIARRKLLIGAAAGLAAPAIIRSPAAWAQVTWTIRVESKWFSSGDGILLASVWQDMTQMPAGLPASDFIEGSAPWNNQQPITIREVHLTHQVSGAADGYPLPPPFPYGDGEQTFDPRTEAANAVTELLLGSGHDGDGPDVIAIAASPHRYSKTTGLNVPQGFKKRPNAAHLDFYGSVYTPHLRQRAIALIIYTADRLRSTRERR
jgi:hypothetical protein